MPFRRRVRAARPDLPARAGRGAPGRRKSSPPRTGETPRRHWRCGGRKPAPRRAASRAAAQKSRSRFRRRPPPSPTRDISAKGGSVLPSPKLRSSASASSCARAMLFFVAAWRALSADNRAAVCQSSAGSGPTSISGPGRDFLAQRVEFFRRVKVEKFAQVRAGRQSPAPGRGGESGPTIRRRPGAARPATAGRDNARSGRAAGRNSCGSCRKRSAETRAGSRVETVASRIATRAFCCICCAARTE